MKKAMDSHDIELAIAEQLLEAVYRGDTDDYDPGSVLAVMENMHRLAIRLGLDRDLMESIVCERAGMRPTWYDEAATK